ncbi:MAG: hypothetical protein EOP48_16920 [Sphingobacteriales bacterium]|nr:MAG: hypothetical protein EOP48_16920 [Sphingobacteriales bacterium]
MTKKLMTPGTSFVVFMQLVGLIMLLVATVISIFIPSTTFKQKCWLGALSVLGFGANITGLIFDKIGADNDQIALISRADSTLRKADLTIQKSDSTMGLLMGIKTDAEEISETVDSVGNIQTRLQSTSQNLVDFNIEVQDQRREQNANQLLTAVIELGQNRFYVHAMQNQPLPDSSILIQVIYNVLDEQYKTLKSEWSNPFYNKTPTCGRVGCLLCTTLNSY